MPKRERSKQSAGGLPIVWRARGDGVKRAYLDARSGGLGGGRIALIAEGETRATTDPATAQRLASELLAQMQEQRTTEQRLGLRRENVLAEAAAEHLEAMRESGKYRPSWILYCAGALDRAILFFNDVQAQQATTPAERKRCASPRNLATVSPPDVRAYMRWLGQQPSGRRGKTLGAGSVREHLAALSAVFARAISDGKLPMGANPVAALLDKPSAPPSPTELLETWELALLLESARTLAEAPQDGRPWLPCAYEYLATFQLLGVREGEARGLDVPDLDFRRNEVHVRGTKTEGADRIVPMPPQLREILLPHVRQLDRLHGPVFTNAQGQRVGDWRGTLDRIAQRAGFARGSVRTRRFRVSYATHRCTCDNVDANTVRLELGHSSLAMMERVYARAQRRSERMGPELAFRMERYAEQPEVAERLTAMRRGPARSRRSDEEMGRVVSAFLAAVGGLGVKLAARESGVDRNAIRRLRAGAATTVQRETAERMQTYLERREPAAA